MNRILFIVATLLFCASLPALTITGDITTDTTWTVADSPIVLDPTGSSGGVIKVKSGKTLYIDSTGGAVEIQWNEDCDLQIGNGMGDLGSLVIDADGNAVTFKIKTGGNILINTHGAISFSSYSAATTFTRYDSGNTWGAIVFEAGQTRQSSFRNSEVSYGGADSRDGMVVVQSSENFTPTFNDTAFSNATSGAAAIRMDGYGLNTFRSGAITPPFDVTSCDYVAYLNATTSSVDIYFPDVSNSSSVTNRLAGTCEVGTSSATSHWLFPIDAYTTKCANSSGIHLKWGSVIGAPGNKPVFQSISGSPGYTSWQGFYDSSDYAILNSFGGLGPISYLEIRDASTAMNFWKQNSNYGSTVWKFTGIAVKHCQNGIGFNIGSGKAIVSDIEIGGTSSGDYCSGTGIIHYGGAAEIFDVTTEGGAGSFGPMSICTYNSFANLYVHDCAFNGNYTTGIDMASPLGNYANVILFERVSITDGGLAAFSSNCTNGFGYDINLTMTFRNCFLFAKSNYGFYLNHTNTGTRSTVFEKCTILGNSGASGLKGVVARSTETVTFRSCNFQGCANGALIDSGSTNLCTYTFDGCHFAANTYGIRDARTQAAHVLAVKCRFTGNGTAGAQDDNATESMVAIDNEWNAPSGPSGSGLLGSGDAVSANVDVSTFLELKPFDAISGGSPASAARLPIKEDISTSADSLHILTTTPYFEWTFGSDFSSNSQGGYELEVDDTANFTSTLWAPGAVSSTSATGITYAGTALSAGNVYYVRIRMKNHKGFFGPWRYSTFRINSTPGTVGNTNRTPADDYGSGGDPDYTDASPQFVWQGATDTDEDCLHYKLDIDNDAAFGSVNVSLTTSTAPTAFEYSTDSGSSWNAFPSGGLPPGTAIRIRCTVPAINVLADGTWNWRVRATDGFANGSYATTWDFVLTRSYTLSGTLLDTGGSAVNGAVIKVAKGGSVLATSDTTDASGMFDVTVTDNLVAGDVLVVFRDGGGSTTRSARLVQFTGANMTGLDLRYKRAYVQQTQAAPIVNGDFSNDDGVDGDIPWTEATAAVTFSGDLAGSSEGVNVVGKWDLTGTVNCTTNDVEFRISATGMLRTLTYNVDLHHLDNNGTLEITGGSRLMIDNSNSTSSGTLRVHDSTLRLKKSGGLTFTVDRGNAEFRAATLDVDTGDTSTLEINTANTADGYASLDCTGSTFSKVGVVIETDGLLVAFNNNVFSTGVSTRHIYWKCTDSRSAGAMRGIQFNYSLGGGEFNVDATSGANRLDMVKCGGTASGEAKESDSNNKVYWSLVPPVNVAATRGDTRVRVAWTSDDQADAANTGYYVYRATSEGGSYSKISGGSPVTDAFYNDSSLSNGTAYWYYVTVVDTNPTVDVESGGSARVTATPAVASISVLAPSSTSATSILAMTVVLANSHMDGSSTLTVTKGGGSGVTVNDTIVLSATLILSDVTLSSATTGTWTVTASRTSVWGIGGYDESDTENLTVSANAASDSQRPTLAFSTSNSGIASDADTSGAFTFNIDFTDRGNGIDTTKFKIYASRDVKLVNVTKTAGTELVAAGLSVDTLNDSRATCTINQTTLTELFGDGECTLTAKVADDSGLYSDWASRRFYVEGAGTNVVKSSTLMLQGSTVAVTVTGNSLSSTDAIDFNVDGATGITVNSASGSGGSITVNVTVAQTATCGPRKITTNNGAKSGVVSVEYPTNILPTNTNAEPPKNAAVGGVGVFLSTGAFFTGATDLSGRGRVMGINWSRFYHSGITYNGPLGNKWVGFYFQQAVYDSGSSDIFWYTPSGRKETFPDVTGGFSNPVGVYMRATRETTYNTITLSDPHGSSCVFNSQGRLWKCLDSNGNKSECFYNYAGQLTEIQTDLAKSFIIAYGADGRVSSVSDKVWSTSSPRVVTYTYDSNGDLTAAKAPETNRYKDANSNRTTYGYFYDSGHRLISCVNPREYLALAIAHSGWLQNTYENGLVVQQQLGESGQNIYIRYVDSDTVRVVDRRKVQTEYTLDADGHATEIERFNKFWTVNSESPIDHTEAPTQYAGKVRASDPDSYSTTFTYNANHEVLVTTLPRGNKVTLTYPGTSSATSGTATSCSGNVLTKTSAGWSTNAFAGKTLRMGTNAGNYRYYSITSNTTDTITVDSPDSDTEVGVVFSLAGDGWNADAYNVFNNNADPLAAGNVLTVTRSDESLGALSDLVQTFTYEPRFQHVKTSTDAKGEVTTYTYDYELSASTSDSGGGNVIMVTGPGVDAGQISTQTAVTRTTYNQYGQPVTQVDAVGNVTQYVYYSGGDNDGYLKNVISSVGDLNLTTEYEYNKAGFMISSWPPKAFDSGSRDDDFETTYEVNELGQTWHTQGQEIRDSGTDRADVYAYFDLNGNVTNTFREYVEDDGGEASPPGSVETSLAFSKASASMTATWIESSAVYNLLNYPVSRAVDAIAGSTVTRYTSYTYYDEEYNVVRSDSPLGNVNATVYDERGMVYQRIAGEYSDVRAVVSTVEYDANGNTVSSTDALANESTFEYDGFDRMTESTDPQGNYRTSSYDANGNVEYSRAYDAAANLMAQTRSYFDEINRTWKTETLAKDYLGNDIGDGVATNVTLFDAAGRVTSSTNDNGVTHYSFYDGANRVTTTRDAKGNEVLFRYNSSSLVTVTQYREVDDLTGANLVSHTTAIYDKSNRRVGFQDQRYNSGTRDTEINWVYDGDGRVTSFTDADGSVTTSLYDLLGRAMQTVRKPDSGSAATWIITANEYDSDSRLTLQQISTNPNTNTTWQTTMYEYDERGRRTETSRADRDVWVYRYDALGNLVEWQDPLTTRVTTAYDSRNMPTSRIIQRGTGIVGTTQENYAYDGLGRLTSAANFDGSTLISQTGWKYGTLGMAEKCTQTIANSAGDIMGTYETGARYDGTGFNTATIFSNGREVIHTPDELNRLAESYDITNGVMIANYAYAGSRLTRRIYGNGTVSNYSYEASGCGCGGATQYVEKIEHKVGLNEQLFEESRRYGLTGTLLASRRGHEGNTGNVYRYDSTYRLKATYYGVDMYDVTGDDDLAGYQTPGTVPGTSAFSLKRAYALDPMGNRTGSSGTKDTDSSASPVTIKDTNYTVSSDKMNLYTSVGGNSYTYDDIEQMTYDGSRGLYYTYDYRGRQIGHDTDSNSATAERIFSYDCMGNRVTEQLFYDDGGGAQTRKETVVLLHNAGKQGGCGGGGGDNVCEEIHYSASPAITGRVQYDYGKGTGTSLVHELAVQGATTVHRFRHENQDGSLLGVTDMNGYRTDELCYQDFGTPMRRKVLFDGQDSRISSLAHSTPGAGYTTITITTSALTTDELNGRELVISRPGNASSRYLTATINDTTATTIVVVDAGGASGPVYLALHNTSDGFKVFDFNDKNITNAATYSTGGKWTGSPSYNGGADETTWTDSGAAFVATQIGCIVELDATKPNNTLTVKSRSGTTIVTAGDTRTLGASGSRYRVYYAPGTDFTNGALKVDVVNQGSGYLTLQSRYLPPQVGVDVSGVIRGAQSLSNGSGTFASFGMSIDPQLAQIQNGTPKIKFRTSWPGRFDPIPILKVLPKPVADMSPLNPPDIPPPNPRPIIPPPADPVIPPVDPWPITIPISIRQFDSSHASGGGLSNPSTWVEPLTKQCEGGGVDIKTITVVVYNCAKEPEDDVALAMQGASGIMLQCCVNLKIEKGDSSKCQSSDKDFYGVPANPNRRTGGGTNYIVSKSTDGYLKRAAGEADGLGEVNGGNAGGSLEPGTIAHEIGHNAGLQHDGHGTGDVMSAGGQQADAYNRPRSFNSDDCTKLREMAK